MDELDLLKKDWNKPSQDKNLSAKDIYPMLHKKSSSIVKTLFYISIAELVFWTLINVSPYFMSASYRAKLDMVYTNQTVFTLVNMISYGIIFLFVYLLFKAHKAISVTDSAKKLMESILKTRKIIKYYVIYNLVVSFFAMVIGIYFGLKNNPEASRKFANATDEQLLLMYAVMIGFTAVFVVIIWLFYKLIYGLLLKRLNRNYNELQKLEL
ncbi:hypothetical protein KFZ70_09945 [Tamlana fucoidanivorans]|uniref:Beta-carotene 15,15'-monooxygenase n=1 Tax=Allotamlana fucoidanivorans TaxID=2583814 RepID=A0A5C4SPS7_9FLAO|nr:hypothetical protein [Tamlana fucoidanivorans]TNJ45813.1 hypothetical protein FGF67_05380 [Tamlana fucoidanivorans]